MKGVPRRPIGSGGGEAFSYLGNSLLDAEQLSSFELVRCKFAVEYPPPPNDTERERAREFEIGRGEAQAVNWLDTRIGFMKGLLPATASAAFAKQSAPPPFQQTFHDSLGTRGKTRTQRNTPAVP